MSLQRHLVLNRWLHALLGADDLEALKGALAAQEEGPGGDGQSHFFRVLAGRRDRKLDEDTLAAYDARLVDYEARLSRARGGLRFKYFQYLALLYAEILLDRLTSDPDALVAELNGFLAAGQARGRFTGIPPFEPDDLRRLAFFLATGRGRRSSCTSTSGRSSTTCATAGTRRRWCGGRMAGGNSMGST